MPRFTVSGFEPLAAALLISAWACGPDPVPDQPVGDVAPPTTRSTDGLLGNPTLQRIVDLQVARDGPGLRTLLSSEDPLVRARAAFALGSVQDPDSIGSILGHAQIDGAGPGIDASP